MKNSVLFALALTFVLFPACSGGKKDRTNYIKVGVQIGPEYQIAETARKVAKEKFGLEVELVSFNDYVMPNAALDQGDLDANVFQHGPYLEDQVKQRGYKIVAVGNTFVYPLAGYSRKISSLSNLREGNTIVIPNDPTNGGRALLLLQKEGLIGLKDGVGYTPKVVDIVENPSKLKIVELEAPQLPRVLDDKAVTIAVINNTFATQAGLLLKDGLFAEDKNSPYVNLIVAREDNKDSENIKKFIQAYQSDEVATVADAVFKGGAVKGW